MYSSICKAEGRIVALENINNTITKGLIYDLLYEVNANDDIYYEIIADDGMYIQLDSKLFYKIK